MTLKEDIQNDLAAAMVKVRNEKDVEAALRTAVQTLQEAVGGWDKFELSADEFFEQGDTVVVLGHTDVAKGDNSASIPVVHIWRWRGEEVCRLQVLTDTYQVAQLLGVA